MKKVLLYLLVACITLIPVSSAFNAEVYDYGIEWVRMNFTSEAVTTSSSDKWNIIGSKYLVNLSAILDVNESQLNTTIDARSTVASGANTTQQMINAANSTGLLINWNSSGWIINWSNRMIKDTNLSHGGNIDTHIGMGWQIPIYFDAPNDVIHIKGQQIIGGKGGLPDTLVINSTDNYNILLESSVVQFHSIEFEAGSDLDNPIWKTNNVTHRVDFYGDLYANYDLCLNSVCIADWDSVNITFTDTVNNTAEIVRAANSTGFLINWNSSGFIKDWNSTGWIINWSNRIPTDTNTWNTTQQMIDAANSTGLLINWNSSGWIINWSNRMPTDTNTWNTTSEMVRGANSTGFLINWNVTGLLINWNSTGWIINWSNRMPTDTDTIWDISTSVYLDNFSTILDVNESVLNSTIDDRTASVTYLPVNITTVSGTRTAGNITSVRTAKDKDYYNVTEASGANPLTVYINFSDVSDFNEILMRVQYSGGSGHEIEVGLWDTTDNDYEEEYGTISDMDDFAFISFNVYDATDHIDANGNVSLRLRHVDSGNPAHEIRIDYISLIDGFSTTTINEHDAFSGRENFDTNHPLYGEWIRALNRSNQTTNTRIDNLAFNTTSQMINATNTTGLLINWNASGFIKDWNSSGWIINWSPRIPQDTNTWNTSQDIQRAVNESNINSTNFKDIQCSQILFDNGKGASAICDGTDDGSSGGNTTSDMIRAVNGTSLNGSLFRNLNCTFIEGSDSNFCVDADTVNTTIQIITAANSTGLLIDWNSSGIIINYSIYDDNTWNTSQEMIDAVNSTGLLINWNASGFIKDWNSSGWIINWSNRIPTDTNTWNTTSDMQRAINGSNINATNFKDVQCSQIIFDNEKGSTAICDGLDGGASGGNTTQEMIDAVNTTTFLKNWEVYENWFSRDQYIFGSSRLYLRDADGSNESMFLYCAGNGQCYISAKNTSLSLLSDYHMYYTSSRDMGFEAIETMYFDSNTPPIEFRHNIEIQGNLSFTESALIDCESSNEVLTTDSNGLIKCITDSTGTGGNTTQEIINAANSTGLLINWNASGFIRDWNSTGWIINWSNRMPTDTNTWNTTSEMVRATQDSYVNLTGDVMTGNLNITKGGYTLAIYNISEGFRLEVT